MYDELLTIDELDAQTRALVAAQRQDVCVTHVGESWNDRPIEMISIGANDGSARGDALIVGVPHSNEPAGAVTVERLIARMLGPDAARERRGLRWHFIKAIDPEGLRLNSGWLKGPRDLRTYSAEFFRPALDRQPDTSFPFECNGYRFDAATPENKAWQKAFDLTRPILHASLHHCDFGGAWHAVSRDIPALTPALGRIIADHGLTAFSDFAIAGWPIEWLSPSVMTYPSASEILTAPINKGKSVQDIWPYGEMSAGYGETHFGTFTLVTEVPLWDDVRLRDDSPSGVTAREQALEGQKLLADLAEFLGRHLGALKTLVGTRDEEEIYAAVQDMRYWTAQYPAHFERLAEAKDAERMLSIRDYFPNGVFNRNTAIRGYAMTARLAAMVIAAGGDKGAAAAEAEAEGRARAGALLDELEAMGAMEPVPVEKMTSIQMESILAAADYFGEAGALHSNG